MGYLLAQDDLTTAGSAKSIYTRGRAKVGTRPSFGGTIGENQYLDGKSGKIGNIALTFEDNDAPEGAIDFAYSVASDKQVYFSKGNLQYTRMSTSDDWSTGTWSFMNHQYDVVETGNVSDDYANETAISLFGWGCTGYEDDRTVYYPDKLAYYCYAPNNTYPCGYEDAVKKIYFYGPGKDLNQDGWIDAYFDDDILYDLSVVNHSDWGYSIDDSDNGWYTLSVYEWDYLMSNHVTSSLCGLAIVNGINGMVLLPDGTSNSNINTSLAVGFAANVYNGNDWLKMEDLGAAFLPAAGKRSGTHNITQVDKCQNMGYYWSASTVDEEASYAYSIDFGTVGDDCYQVDYEYDEDVWESRHVGYSVRLVYDITSE